MHNNSEGKKQQVEDHRRNFKFSNNKTFVTACNDSLNAKPSKVNFVCVTYVKCVLNDNHDMRVLYYINGVNYMTKMPMAVPISIREHKRTMNQSAATPLKRTVAAKSTNQNLRSTIRKQYVQISKTCRRWYCKITPPGYKWKPKSRTVNVEPNFIEIILFIVDSGCSRHITGNLKLLSNFMEQFLGTVKFENNQIAPILGYRDLVQGKVTIKGVYYIEGLNYNLFFVGQFCYSDLEVAFWKSTCYIRNLKGNDLLTGIEQQTLTAQTPKQNGIIERQNRTLVEAVRTMLSAAKVCLFFWAEAITTACFMQNRSLVIPRHEKTPNHIINGRKLSVKFFYIFGSLCYIVRDGENFNKMKEKEHRWTKDHPLEQVIRNPSQSIRTRRQLETNGEMCMFALIMSQTKLKNIKKAMTDSAWIEAMQEELYQFDRLDIHQFPRAIFINQAKYAQKILKKHGMTSCDSVGTPMATKPIDADLSGTHVDQTKYRSMVEAFMYLTACRPDIIHATCYCARYQARPTEKHLREVKRIFWYLKNTINMGLWYPKDTSLNLTAHSYSDHAGCNDTRKSTSSGIQFLGGDKLVNWSLKKQDCTLMSPAKPKLAKKNKLKACGTLLMVLPDKYQLKFNSHKDAKTLMEAIEKRFGGNTETKKVLKTILKQQYENFSGSSTESLDKIHDMLQKLISQLEILRRNKTDLEEQSLDDLFNSLKIYEDEVKSSSSAGTITQNIDFVSSSNTDSTNEQVNDAASVSVVCAKMHVSSLPHVDSLSNAMIKRNLEANGPTSLGFDMSKVECYNCYRKGHFARECRSPKDSRRNGAVEPQRRSVPVETTTSNALVSQCLESVEARILVYKQNEYVFEEDIKLLNLEVQLRNNALVSLRQTLEKAEQERDDLKLKLEKFQTSSKNLTELLASQTNANTCLGYNSQVFTRAMFDCDDYLSLGSDESLPRSPIYDRYQSGNGYHAVPPPYTRTFMPPKPDLVFNNEPNDVETDHPAFTVKISPTKPDQDLSHTNRPSTPIIEDWVFDFEDESETKTPQTVPSFIQSTEQVNSPRPSVQHVETSIPVATPKTTIPKPTSNDKHRNRKACFVCKSLDHLIKDYDYHEKKMAQPTTRNHAHRGNHKHYAQMTHQNPQKHMVPTAVLTQSKPVPITAVRPVSTAIPKLTVTRPKQVKPIVTKSTSPTKRHPNQSPSLKDSNSPPRVTVVKDLLFNAAQENLTILFLVQGNPQHALKDKGVIDSGFSRHMIGNMSYLSDFEELNGGYVSFGGNPKGGKIFGKEKVREEIDQQYVRFPVWSSGSTNPQNTDGDATFNEKEPEFNAKKPEFEVNISPSSSAQSKKQDDKTKREAKGKSPVESFTRYINLSVEFEDFSDNSINEVNAAELEDITYSDDEDDVGAEADFNNLETSITVSPIPTTRVHKDHSVTQIIGDLSSATQTRSRKSASTPIDKEKPLLKDPDVKRIFRYLKGKPHLGLWYPKDSPFDLVAYSNSDYAGASLDRKSTTGGCQFYGCRLIFWQCKKQTVMATLSTEAEYVAATSFCAQVLWIQNQLLDYGANISGKEFLNPFMAGSLPKRVNTPRCDEDRLEQIELLVFLLPSDEKVKVKVSAVDLQVYAVRHILLLLVQKFLLFGLTNWCCSLSAVSEPKHLCVVHQTVLDHSCCQEGNDVIRLQALVDKKKVVVMEATIRDALRLDNAEGVECLPNEEIFAELASIGYEKPSTKLTFYKGMLVAHEVKEGNAVENVENVNAGDAVEGDVNAANDEVPTVDEEPSILSPTQPIPPPQQSHDIPSTSQDARIPLNLLQEVMDICTALTRRVEHLELDKIAQALEITRLKRKVNKLERRNKVKVLKLRRLHKVGTAQRIDTSNDTVMDGVSNQERMIADMDADADVVLEEAKEVAADNAKDNQDTNVLVNANIQGMTAESQAKIYKIDLDHANKVLSMQEEESEPAELQEVVNVVTTAKIITEVVTVASITITGDEVPVPTAIIADAPTLTAAPRRRTKGMVIKDPEESSTTTSIIFHSEAKSKDKGKRILVEEPKPLKKQAQIKEDENYARELEAEYQAMKRKPQTEAQARKNIMVHLKNVVGFKMDYFKGMTYDDIRPVFEKHFHLNMAFLQKTKEKIDEEESKALKRINETPAKKAAKRQKLEEEVKELKRHLQIVPNEDDDVYTEATPLARKVPVVDYEIIN
nr:copia protein [Tanacetum cinerariifolium]